ncbi:MAG: hypothetical protein RL441_1360 [Actinomycetota bacterium]|jgi:hypothetical protein
MNLGVLGWLVIAVQLLVVFSGMVGFFDALRRGDDAFAAVGRGSKMGWLIGLLAASLAVFLQGMASLFGLIGTVAIVVYHVDQKPKLKDVIQPRW